MITAMKFCAKEFRVHLFLAVGALLSAGFSPVQLQDIEIAIIKEDFVAAERLAGSFIDHHQGRPESRIARYYLGLSLLSQEKYDRARAVFEQVSDDQREDSWWDKARIGLVDCFILSGDYEAARTAAEHLLKSRPDSELRSLVYLKLARSHLRLARWTEARKYLQMILSDFPGSPEAHLARQLLEEEQYFAVQVGAFLERQRAENLMSQMKRRGEYAYIVETVDKTGAKFYRVRIGRFSQLAEAQGMEKRLSELGYPTLIYP